MLISKNDYQMLRNLEDFQYLSIDRFDQLMAATRLRKAPKNHILFFKSKVNLFLITRQITTIFYIYQKKLQHF